MWFLGFCSSKEAGLCVLIDRWEGGFWLDPQWQPRLCFGYPTYSILFTIATSLIIEEKYSFSTSVNTSVFFVGFTLKQFSLRIIMCLEMETFKWYFLVITFYYNLQLIILHCRHKNTHSCPICTFNPSYFRQKPLWKPNGDWSVRMCI